MPSITSLEMSTAWLRRRKGHQAWRLKLWAGTRSAVELSPWWIANKFFELRLAWNESARANQTIHSIATKKFQIVVAGQRTNGKVFEINQECKIHEWISTLWEAWVALFSPCLKSTRWNWKPAGVPPLKMYVSLSLSLSLSRGVLKDGKMRKPHKMKKRDGENLFLRGGEKIGSDKKRHSAANVQLSATFRFECRKNELFSLLF